MARDIELIIRGRDVGATSTMRKVGRAMQRAAKDADNADEKLAKVGKRLGKATLSGIGGLAKVGATVAAIASAAGPAVSGLLMMGKAVAAIGAGAVKIAPLVTILPAIAASLALIVGTIKLAGPEIGRKLAPIADAFKSIRGEIGELASEGLRQVAREFNRVNFPVIAKGMREIAKDVNLVVKGFGQWVNSARGQHTIKELVEATSDATERLDGRVLRLGIAFGEMLGRVGRAGIEKVTDLLVKMSEAGIRWLNSIDKSDVDGAFKALGGWSKKIRETFHALVDMGKWMADNEEQVKRFGDIAAGVAIALGAATGNWIAVLAGAASLSINHWDDLKKASGSGGKAIADVWRGMKDDPNLKALRESIGEAFAGFRDSFNEATKDIAPKWRAMVRELKLAWEEWGPIITAWWEGVAKPALSAAGAALGFWTEHVITSVTVSSRAFTILGAVLERFLQVVLAVFGKIINAAAAAFGFIPGIGPALTKAADDFNKFRDRVNGALDGIHKDITIGIKTKGMAGVTGSNEQFNVRVGRRAHGGFVQRGQSYIVGDRGVPEVFQPNQDGRIQSTVPSGAMDRMSVGGRTEVVLRIDSGGSDVDNLLVELLKRAARGSGGTLVLGGA